ncbi:MAG: hypothetical protein KatS3mg105_0082 [Gemmatales bacterium]|nr:MAG: hypothetical protein KatS3mg105_0082 [Gemmatales bacterium]
MTARTLKQPQSGFHSLKLSAPVLRALAKAKYKQPSPIQAAVVPLALSGADVIGQAQTGTGKTAAFLLPFLNNWKDKGLPGPEALVLAPTRELVVQVAEEAQKLAPNRHCKTLAIYGGQRIRGQLQQLKQGCTIVVGTPGRILDHLARGTLKLDGVPLCRAGRSRPYARYRVSTGYREDSQALSEE